MPGNAQRMFINVVHSCPNACFFCVDFKGETFYGFDLKRGKPSTTKEIIKSVEDYPNRHLISEVYICGIGEPLLRYDTVVLVAEQLRSLFSPQTVIAVNTSGTFYLRFPRVDFATRFDLIQVSLNAENEEKYNLICRPKVMGAYQALMQFLHHLKQFLSESKHPCRVELTVVDTSDRQHLPEAEQLLPEILSPDIDACRRIADSFGWPLKVKTLIKDCERPEWSTFAESFQTEKLAAAYNKRLKDAPSFGRR